MRTRKFAGLAWVSLSLWSAIASAETRFTIAADESCAISASDREERIRYLEARLTETRGQIKIVDQSRRDLEDVLRSMNSSYKISGYTFLASIAILNAATFGELQLTGANSLLLKGAAMMFATSMAAEISYPIIAEQMLEQRPLHQLYLILNPNEAPTPTERSFYSDERFALVRHFLSAPRCPRGTCSVDHPVLNELYDLAYKSWRKKKAALDDENHWFIPQAFDHATGRMLAEADIPYARFLLELLRTEEEFFELQLEVLREDGKVCRARG